jgi:hypothetical protein
VTPLPGRRAEPVRRPPVTQTLEDEDATAAPPAVAIRRPNIADTDRATDRAENGDDPARVPPVPRDGDAPGGMEEVTARDGEFVVGEGEPLQRDGDPPADADPRLKANVDAFERPAAGYDAIAFQIDDVAPLLDRRPARLARFEPYDPLGIRRGSWIVFPEVEVGIGATNNILRAPGRDGAGFLDARPTVRVISNLRRHAVELRGTGLVSANDGFMTENDKAYALEARARFDIARSTNVSALVSHARDQEARQARDAIDGARARGDIDTTRLALAFNHRVGSFGLQVRGGLANIDYAPVVTRAGLTITNTARDVFVRDAAIRGTWFFTPALAGFTEVQIIDRAYAEVTADGILRDSTGWRSLAGLTFGGPQTVWRGEIAAGYGVQTPNDTRLKPIEGMIFDANLGWRITGLTSLLLTARTDLNDAVTAGRDGSVTWSGGIELRHAFRRHLIGTAGVRHTLTDYRGVDLTERETTADLGLEYALDRATTLFAKYSHVWFDSSVAGAGYQVDAVRLGLRWRR